MPPSIRCGIRGMRPQYARTAAMPCTPTRRMPHEITLPGHSQLQAWNIEKKPCSQVDGRMEQVIIKPDQRSGTIPYSVTWPSKNTSMGLDLCTCSSRVLKPGRAISHLKTMTAKYLWRSKTRRTQLTVQSTKAAFAPAVWTGYLPSLRSRAMCALRSPGRVSS